MTVQVLDLDDALAAMHEVASRLTPGSWQHPGQVTWSARYALPEELDHGPVGVFRVGGQPVGCSPEHRRRGLASAVSLAALHAAHAAHAAGATTGLVRPRGDDGSPEPGRVYRGIGFRPGPRTHDWPLTRS